MDVDISLPGKPFFRSVYHYVKIKVVKYDQRGCGADGGTDGFKKKMDGGANGGTDGRERGRERVRMGGADGR